MTTLALLELNPRSKEARRSFRDPALIHRILMACFPQAHSQQARSEFGVLWRIEPYRKPTIMMQSQAIPDLDALPDQYAKVQSKSLDPHLKSLFRGQTVRFRAVLNPVRTSRVGSTNRQHVIRSAERPAWAANRVAASGLALSDPPVTTGLPTRNLTKNGKRITVYSIQIDGIARISDADSLRKSLKAGIGRAKAWGCGLLTVLHA